MVMWSGKEKGREERYSREIGNSIGVMGYVPKISVGEFLGIRYNSETLVWLFLFFSCTLELVM